MASSSMRRGALPSLVAVFICLSPMVVLSDDALGCGGFLSSSKASIDFSAIEVKLETLTGATKYTTECNPNGYYFMPLYDKGRFVLKVEPPKGWTFEPNQLEVNIDGTTDVCSRGEDVNFEFRGFSLYGQVMSAGRSEGPPGVTMEISGADSFKQSITTGPKGKYTVPQVLPGTYTITASHPSWSFGKISTTVTVVDDNVNIPNEIEVSGYSVEATVTCDGEPVSGVDLLLYSDDIVPGSIDCGKVSEKSAALAGAHGKPVCGTVSNDQGKFLLRNVPTGTHKLVPLYYGEQTAFDVVPSEMSVSVEYSNVVLEKSFKVEGFSVSGKVVDHNAGPIVGAAVAITGKDAVVTTDESGSFVLEHISKGKYTFTVSKDGYKFDPVDTLLSAADPKLSPIQPSSYQVCGVMNLGSPPAGTSVERSILLQSSEGSEISSTKTDDNKFCFMVEPGTFSIVPVISATEKKSGLALTPTSQTITVVDKPIDDLTFTQVLASISGEVDCLEDCSNVAITVQQSDRDFKETADVQENGGKTTFELQGVLPGTYKITIERPGWCWKEKTLEIDVTDEAITGVNFKQGGYLLKLTTSHEAGLAFSLPDANSTKVDRFTAVKGQNRFCLAVAGVYNVKPQSCYKFQKDVYQYDTRQKTVLDLVVTHYLIEGKIETSRPCDELTLSPKLLHGEALENGAEIKGDGTEYSYSLWAPVKQKVKLTPSGCSLLFEPRQITGGNTEGSCPAPLVTIKGQDGVFVSGSVTPPIEGVEVTVQYVSEDEGSTSTVVHTDSDGKYRFGPLHHNTGVEVSAELDSYVLVPTDDPPRNFAARKLGLMVISVVDQAGQPLKGVLVSLSGGKYRKNTNTDENGQIRFNNLAPEQYFVRPMLKEYSFEPKNSNLMVEEGTESTTTFTATRTAFSCFGVITSLNGDPEKGVVVEASSTSGDHRDDTVSEADGSFRIRGLKPGSEYVISVKDGNNVRIEQSTPASLTVKVDGDVFKNDFLVFRKQKKFDLTGYVNTPKKFLSTITVNLFLASAPESLLHSANVGATPFIEFRSLAVKDDDQYLIKVSTTTSSHEYSYNIDNVLIPASGDKRHVSLNFQPMLKHKHLASGSPDSSAMFPLIMFIVLGTVTLYSNTVLSLATQLKNRGLKILTGKEKLR